MVKAGRITRCRGPGEKFGLEGNTDYYPSRINEGGQQLFSQDKWHPRILYEQVWGGFICFPIYEPLHISEFFTKINGLVKNQKGNVMSDLFPFFPCLWLLIIDKKKFKCS